MDVSEILKQQQAALDALQQAAAIQTRIDELSRQKDATMRRYDTAIEEQKNLLATLQSVMADTGRPPER